MLSGYLAIDGHLWSRANMNKFDEVLNGENQGGVGWGLGSIYFPTKAYCSELFFFLKMVKMFGANRYMDAAMNPCIVLGDIRVVAYINGGGYCKQEHACSVTRNVYANKHFLPVIPFSPKPSKSWGPSKFLKIEDAEATRGIRSSWSQQLTLQFALVIVSESTQRNFFVLPFFSASLDEWGLI